MTTKEKRIEALKVLGLEDSANEADIKRAYRDLALKTHPDKSPVNKDGKAFRAVKDAYDIALKPVDQPSATPHSQPTPSATKSSSTEGPSWRNKQPQPNRSNTSNQPSATPHSQPTPSATQSSSTGGPSWRNTQPQPQPQPNPSNINKMIEEQRIAEAIWFAKMQAAFETQNAAFQPNEKNTITRIVEAMEKETMASRLAVTEPTHQPMALVVQPITLKQQGQPFGKYEITYTNPSGQVGKAVLDAATSEVWVNVNNLVSITAGVKTFVARGDKELGVYDDTPQHQKAEIKRIAEEHGLKFFTRPRAEMTYNANTKDASIATPARADGHPKSITGEPVKQIERKSTNPAKITPKMTPGG